MAATDSNGSAAVLSLSLLRKKELLAHAAISVLRYARW
jgi:hypothetical protein